MSKDNPSSSDDSSDAFPLEFHGMLGLPSPNIGLEADWEAVEQTLYQEDVNKANLKPNIIHECRLWRDSFPYLRIHGKKIDNPINQRKIKLKQHVIASVVDQLIEKISGEGLNLNQDKVQRPAVLKKESYFERGKKRTKHESSLVTPRVSTTTLPSLQEPTTQLETQPKPLPRGILKNSPKRTLPSEPQPRERRKTKRKTASLNSFRNTSLPRISSRNNNWLNRSERRCSETLPCCHRKAQNLTKDKFILPPITPK